MNEAVSVPFLRISGFSLVLAGVLLVVLGLPFAAVFMIIGLAGVQALQAPRARISGWLGLILAAFGMLGVILWTRISGLPEALQTDLAVFSVVVIMYIAIGIMALGLVILGSAIAASRVFPRWSGVLLIIGILLNISAGQVGGLVLACDLVWLGILLLTGRYEAP